MATEIKASEANRQIGHLLDRASRGEVFTVTRYGRPLAVIGPPRVEAPEVTVARENLAAFAALNDQSPTGTGYATAAGALAASLQGVLAVLDPEGPEARERA